MTSDLVATVTEAYGGLEAWRQYTSMTARMTYGGPFWEFKGQPTLAGVELVRADLRRQRIVHRQESTGRTIEFDKHADLVTVYDDAGVTLERLASPRKTFAGFTTETRWGLAQAGYFRAYSTWHYLLEPTLFTFQDVDVEEGPVHVEDGQRWRVLNATFPPSIDTHSRRQSYYFDEDGLQRRMDYWPEVNGDVPVAHYVEGHHRVGGVIVATRRNVFQQLADGSPDRSWLPIWVELSDVHFGTD